MLKIVLQVLEFWNNPPESREKRLQLLHKSFELLGVPKSQWPKTVGKYRNGDMEIWKIKRIHFSTDVNLMFVIYECIAPNGSHRITIEQFKRYSEGDTVQVVVLAEHGGEWFTVLRQVSRAADGLFTDFPRGFYPGEPKDNPINAVEKILRKNVPGVLAFTKFQRLELAAKPGPEDNSASPQKLWTYVYICKVTNEEFFDENGLRSIIEKSYKDSPLQHTQRIAMSALRGNKVISIQRVHAILASYKESLGRTAFKKGWMNDSHSKVGWSDSTDLTEETTGIVKKPWTELKELI